MMFPAAVFWDLDGTLVDSEEYWIEAVTQFVETQGGTLTDVLRARLIGASAEGSAEVAVEAGATGPRDRLVHDIVDAVSDRLSRRVPFLPGALDLIDDIASGGVPQAIVTQSWRTHVTHVLAAMPSGAGIDLAITGDEVSRPKPAPDPYLLAAARLGVDPQVSVAIEDSRAGITAALAAGMRVVAVPRHDRLDGLPVAATWPSLETATFDDLRSLGP